MLQCLFIHSIQVHQDQEDMRISMKKQQNHFVHNEDK